jgi:hypothetical protein
MQSAYYKNLAFEAFGEGFYGKTPSQVLHHFKVRSPFYRDSTIREYADFLAESNGAPFMGEGECFDAYAERLFDHLIAQNIVTFEGSNVTH